MAVFQNALSIYKIVGGNWQQCFRVQFWQNDNGTIGFPISAESFPTWAPGAPGIGAACQVAAWVRVPGNWPVGYELAQYENPDGAIKSYIIAGGQPAEVDFSALPTWLQVIWNCFSGPSQSKNLVSLHLLEFMVPFYKVMWNQAENVTVDPNIPLEGLEYDDGENYSFSFTCAGGFAFKTLTKDGVNLLSPGQKQTVVVDDGIIQGDDVNYSGEVEPLCQFANAFMLSCWIINEDGNTEAHVSGPHEINGQPNNFVISDLTGREFGSPAVIVTGVDGRPLPAGHITVDYEGNHSMVLTRVVDAEIVASPPHLYEKYALALADTPNGGVVTYVKHAEPEYPLSCPIPTEGETLPTQPPVKKDPKDIITTDPWTPKPIPPKPGPVPIPPPGGGCSDACMVDLYNIIKWHGQTVEGRLGSVEDRLGALIESCDEVGRNLTKTIDDGQKASASEFEKIRDALFSESLTTGNKLSISQFLAKLLMASEDSGV